MKIKVKTLQEWCNSNITPLAWQRVIIKVLPELREKGFELDELEAPSDDRFFQEPELKIFETALSAIYDMSFPKEITEKA